VSVCAKLQSGCVREKNTAPAQVDARSTFLEDLSHSIHNLDVLFHFLSVQSFPCLEFADDISELRIAGQRTERSHPLPLLLLTGIELVDDDM
jgi:hypothetical protein